MRLPHLRAGRDRKERAMGYIWTYDNDAAPAVTAGVNAQIAYVRVIERNDNLGGYNVMFSVAASLALYHVHFNRGGTQVNAVRYFPQPNVQGDNVVRFIDGGGDPAERSSLQSLAYYCRKQEFPNHETLLTNLRNAIANVPRQPNGELQ
jgi:hypothetical protein